MLDTTMASHFSVVFMITLSMLFMNLTMGEIIILRKATSAPAIRNYSNKDFPFNLLAKIFNNTSGNVTQGESQSLIVINGCFSIFIFSILLLLYVKTFKKAIQNSDRILLIACIFWLSIMIIMMVQLLLTNYRFYKSLIKSRETEPIN